MPWLVEADGNLDGEGLVVGDDERDGQVVLEGE